MTGGLVVRGCGMGICGDTWRVGDECKSLCILLCPVRGSMNRTEAKYVPLSGDIA